MKIFLCDANFSVIPILQSIMNRENIVSVAGSKLDDPCHHIADKSVYIDYSHVTDLFLHIKKQSYDYIIPGCNDRSYLSLAQVAEPLLYPGFDCFDVATLIHNKDSFRRFSEEKGYPVPKAVSRKEDVIKLSYPIIIKPVDSFSGKGINKLDNETFLDEYWSEAESCSNQKLVVAEEFVDGNLYSHSAFIRDKKIVIDFFVNEYCTVYPYQVNSSNVSTLLPEKIQEGLRSWVEQFADDLDLVDGLVHTQFISDGNSFSLIEVARRGPGDLYSELIKKSTGIDYAELYSLPFLGKKLPKVIEKKNEKFISRHTVSVDSDCIYINSGIDVKSNKFEMISLKKSGEKMMAAPYDKSGIYFIENFSSEEMEEITKKLKNNVFINKIKT